MPALVREPNLDVQDDKVQTAGQDKWISDSMRLPGAGDGQVAGFEQVFPLIYKKYIAAGFLKGQFDPLIAV